MEIKEVFKDKHILMPLFLLADPCENMVYKYLDKSRVFAVFQDGEPVCAAVMADLGEGQAELKNIAVKESLQNKGFASAMLAYIFNVYGNGYHVIFVGTSEKGVSFYEQFGFAYSHKQAGFFTDNYPEPIYEDGSLCRDMIYLKKEFF